MHAAERPLNLGGVTCAHHLREARSATFHFLPFATTALAACDSPCIPKYASSFRQPGESTVSRPPARTQLFDSSAFWVKRALLLQKGQEPEENDPD